MESDPALPQRSTLLGRGAHALVAAALRPSGAELVRLRRTQVRYEPGRRLTVRYAAVLRAPDGCVHTDTVVATARRGRLPDGVAVLEDAAGRRVGVWRYPHDPELPGLPALADPAAVRHLLDQLGVRAAEVDVRPVVYRPGQRAVLRVAAGAGTLFVKVLRPERAEAVHRAHQALAPHAPVPRSLGWSARHGVVVLEALPGERLADRLSARRPPPAPRSLLAPLHDIAAVPLPPACAPAAGEPAAALAAHAKLLRTLLPDQHATVDALERFAAGFAPAADRTVHGDFYEGQVLVRDREVAGMLDVDGVRPGAHVEDVATLVAHLDGLALVRPAAARHIAAYRAAVEACAGVDRDALRRAVAGTLLGLSTGPFRLQEAAWPAWTRRWLALARSWLPADEAALTGGSSPAHVAGAA